MRSDLRDRRITLWLSVFILSVFVLRNLQDGVYRLLPEYGYGGNTGPIWSATQDSEVIRSLSLNTSSIDYRRYCFSAVQNKDTKRRPLIDLSWPLLGDTHADQIAAEQLERDGFNRACQQGQILHVPFDHSNPQVNTGVLMLGVATFMERIKQSLPEMARWLANTDTKLLVILRDKSPKTWDLQAVMDMAERLGIDVTLVSDPSMTGEAESNFGLATYLHKSLSDDTRWIGIIDDDTFFPSLPRLLASLAPYDPSLPWYIGGLSERRLSTSREGFKAWGGAGIFFSRPLLTTLAENSQECLSMAKKWGDALWRDCVFKVTTPTVHLTRLAGLNQLDMFGNMAGWYESDPYPMLSIHHWKSWHQFPVPLAHLVTDVAGVDSFLQRYSYIDNVVFTNGYSIVQYPDGLPDMNLVEGTMHPYPGAKMPGAGGEFKDSLGRLRPALEEGRQKISWTFATAVTADNGCVRQFYVKGASAGQNDVDSVIEVDWCRG
ncbi:hypothetical protein QM012_003423 [Aureobasidium pullulans]|uniref:Glycosyltransferase family 31 protein n=1 Tax=Aureobasidium pullulans TaxID=5580 RepID=A0ABR0T8D4_AURPU